MPAFVALWVVSVLLDFLPTIEERIPLQAVATISVALARALLVAAGAWLTADMSVIVWLLVATVLLKFALLIAYTFEGLVTLPAVLRAAAGRSGIPVDGACLETG